MMSRQKDKKTKRQKDKKIQMTKTKHDKKTNEQKYQKIKKRKIKGQKDKYTEEQKTKAKKRVDIVTSGHWQFRTLAMFSILACQLYCHEHCHVKRERIKNQFSASHQLLSW